MNESKPDFEIPPRILRAQLAVYEEVRGLPESFVFDIHGVKMVA